MFGRILHSSERELLRLGARRYRHAGRHRVTIREPRIRTLPRVFYEAEAEKMGVLDMSEDVEEVPRRPSSVSEAARARASWKRELSSVRKRYFAEWEARRSRERSALASLQSALVPEDAAGGRRKVRTGHRARREAARVARASRREVGERQQALWLAEVDARRQRWLDRLEREAEGWIGEEEVEDRITEDLFSEAYGWEFEEWFKARARAGMAQEARRRALDSGASEWEVFALEHAALEAERKIGGGESASDELAREPERRLAAEVELATALGNLYAAPGALQAAVEAGVSVGLLSSEDSIRALAGPGALPEANDAEADSAFVAAHRNAVRDAERSGLNRRDLETGRASVDRARHRASHLAKYAEQSVFSPDDPDSAWLRDPETNELLVDEAEDDDIENRLAAATALGLDRAASLALQQKENLLVQRPEILHARKTAGRSDFETSSTKGDFDIENAVQDQKQRLEAQDAPGGSRDASHRASPPVIDAKGPAKHPGSMPLIPALASLGVDTSDLHGKPASVLYNRAPEIVNRPPAWLGNVRPDPQDAKAVLERYMSGRTTTTAKKNKTPEPDSDEEQ